MSIPDAHTVRLRRLPHADGLPLPARATRGAAGLDLCAAISFPVVLCPGDYELIPTGFCLELPEGVEAQIRPRSGLALKHGVTVLNSPGTIDPDYRGEVAVLLINSGNDTVVIQRGDRIAQMVLARFLPAACVEAESISETARGAGGFGSTGTGSV